MQSGELAVSGGFSAAEISQVHCRCVKGVDEVALQLGGQHVWIVLQCHFIQRVEHGRDDIPPSCDWCVLEEETGLKVFCHMSCSS